MPPEALVIPFLIAIPMRGPAGFPPALAALFLTGLLVLKLADMATMAAYGRSFNILADRELPGAAANLLAGTLGLPRRLIELLFIAVPLAVFILLRWLLGHLQSLLQGLPHRRAVPLALIAAALAILPGNYRALLARAQDTAQFAATLSQFDRDLAQPAPRHADLSALQGADIEIIFVESYGRASFEVPLYAAEHTPLRRAAEASLRAAGLSSLSGWLAAPVAGGQSWLAHATFAAGVPVPDQLRYRRLLASARPTLFQIARDAGYHTAAFMPAITMDWPEGDRLGFDTIIAADGFSYRGPAFNWVTMPDQFTLQAVERLSAGLPHPRLSQIVLISSHAPFTPIPPILDPGAVGDGTVFQRFAASGPAPDELWRDRERVRSAYGTALAYSLRVALAYGQVRAGQGALVIILGDHPPAGFISGIGSPDVPIHLIGSPERLAPFHSLSFTPGLDPATPSWPMETFRDRFLAAASQRQD
uniref:Sulfatase N-terminal domain-containing protein n=2 Tax=Aureimonas frigidaquae TaxID=424757 RepID=A0A0P0Z3X0_9HYPH|nr:hypothetical protein [Aureimonas frigidaquae]